MLASTLDYDKMKQQDGDEEIIPFSFMNEGRNLEEIRDIVLALLYK